MSERESSILLVVRLFVHPGHEEEFREFETRAAAVMRRHGGRIDRVIRPTASSPPEALPHEIHLVAFPDRGRFEAYRADPELAALAPLRQRAIARTDVTFGEAGEPYF